LFSGHACCPCAVRVVLGERRVRYGRHEIVYRTEHEECLLVAGLVPQDSAKDRGDAPRRLSMATSLQDRQLRVLPATVDRWADVIACFGRRGNDPAWCWCQRFIGPPADGDNRAALRRQITAAAVDLHSTVGPARTTISAIAERAGVQRLTVYRHFPEERDLFAACGAHWISENPPPDPAPCGQPLDFPCPAKD